MKKKDLVRQCEILRESVTSRNLGTEEECQEVWPQKGLKSSLEDWIMCHSNLVRMRGREEWLMKPSQEAEEELLKAVRDLPERLQLLSGSEVWIYPKSFHALCWFREMAWAVNWLASRMEMLKVAMEEGEIEKKTIPEPVKTLEKASGVVPWLLACLCREACREGVQLTEHRMEPGQEFLDLDPVDVLRIQGKFQEVNGTRLMNLEAVVKSQGPGDGGGDGRMSWNVFFGSLSTEANGDIGEYVRDRSLVSVLSQVSLAQAARRKAEKEAKNAVSSKG